MGAIDDILQWSEKLSPWRQDALRRLASSSTLTDNDRSELLAAIQVAAGFNVKPKPPAPSPLTKAHFSGVTGGAPIKLKAVRNVENVNRLVTSASLIFAPDGLTIIYGRNGSGKSGFVRILRTACRTRTDNPAKLKVLANVYGSGGGPQKAEIVVDVGSNEVLVPWTAGSPATDALLQVAVFDNSAAQLYVDSGNQIQFLPFGLALPHKLNELCLTLKETLETQRKIITDQIALAVVTFATPRPTKAQTFYLALSAKTSDQDIQTATKFGDNDENRLNELTSMLTASSASAVDMKALATWIQAFANDCDAFVEALNDPKLEEYAAVKQTATAARSAANIDADGLFASEPLPGVGGESWRRLWLAARDFSIADAYPAQVYPVTGATVADAKCVLCQQVLLPEASDRLTRFQAFVSGALAEAADKAESDVTNAVQKLPDLNSLNANDWLTRIEQIQKRNEPLSNALVAFKNNLTERLALASEILAGTQSIPGKPLPSLESPSSALTSFAKMLSKEAEDMAAATKSGERDKLVLECAELADLKLVAAGRPRLIVRRNLLIQDGLYASALAEVQTKGITQKANELVDSYLTTAVTKQFDTERIALEISHLKIGLARKSGQTKATFQTDPGTKLTKSASEILSEGEQRALALAAFFTEISVTDGAGPIVIDDPVSSLDRQRGLKVATRLAKEALKRQVIVFTHDLIFFNDLCHEADSQGVKIGTISLFSDGDSAGKVDPSGISWKGLAVNKRIGIIRNEFAPIRKLHSSNPSEYEMKVKNLYGRLRDSYERVVEECIFCDIIRRGVDKIETQKLRMVHLSDALAIRFNDGMTKANTYSHDNPASDTVPVPDPAEFDGDLAYIESLVKDLRTESANAELNRPTMKPK